MKLSISTQRLQPIFLVAFISINVFFPTASPSASIDAASVPDTPRVSQQKTCGHDRADPQLVTDSYGIASAPADALIDWFTSNGGTISNLAVDVGEGAKGEGECEKRRGAESDVRACKRPQWSMRTISGFEKGEVLISVPPKLWISERHAANDVMPFQNAPWLPVLAGWVLREKAKGSSSFWAPYIESLPLKVGLPDEFDLKTREAIESPGVISEITDRLAQLTLWHKQMSPESTAHASLADLHWAVNIARSRAFGVDLKKIRTQVDISDGHVSRDAHPQTCQLEEGCQLSSDGDRQRRAENEVEFGEEEEEEEEEDGLGLGGDFGEGAWNRTGGSLSFGDGEVERVVFLVPVWDLIDHGEEDLVYWQVSEAESESGGALEMYGRDPASPNRKIRFLYQRGVTDWLFLDYGFVPETNKHDSFLLFASDEDLLQATQTVLHEDPELRSHDSPTFAEALGVGGEAIRAVRGMEEEFIRLRPEEAGEGLVGSGWGGGLDVLVGGRVQARVIAAMAAMWHSVRYGGKEVLDLEELALVSIGFGHAIDNTTCDDVASESDQNLVAALHFAVRSIHELCEKKLDSYGTRIKLDAEIVTSMAGQIEGCKSGTLGGEECVLYENGRLESLYLVVRFRLSKKMLLKNAMDRFQRLCKDAFDDLRTRL